MNSGNSAYVEIPMDKTGALFGDNNEGKTSGLSALKLFVLPETNFKDCKTKFGFQSGGDYYRPEQSFNHYFPANSSFIVCEAENPKGRFCVVLHRSSEEWGYARIAVPCPYEKIQHLFWDFDSDANEGYGAQIPGLNLSDTIKTLKKAGGIPLKNKQEMREAIYSRPGPVDDLSRFCLIPLVQKGDRGSISALRSLLGLAFDIKSGAKNTLPQAIATIIEAENTGKDSSLTIDVGEITNEYSRLQASGKRLQAIRSCQTVWGDLAKAFDYYRKIHASLRQDYGTLYWQAELLKKDIQAQHDRFAEERNGIAGKLTDAKQTHRQAKSDLDNCRRDLKIRTGDLKEKNTQIERIHFVRSQHSPLGITEDVELIDYLEQSIPSFEDDIEALNSSEAAVAQMERMNAKRVELESNIGRLELQLKKQQHSMLEDISEHARSVLHSINPAFDFIHASPSDEEVAVIEAFSHQLQSQDKQVTFLGEKLQDVEFILFDPKQAHRQLSDKLATKKGELSDLNKDMQRKQSDIKNAKSPQYREEKLQELNEELNQTREDIELITHAGMLEKQAAELMKVTDELEPKKELLEQKEAETHTAHSTLKFADLKLDGEISALLPNLDEVKRQTGDLTRFYQAAMGLQDTAPPESESGPKITLDELTTGITQLEAAARSYPRYRQTTIELMGSMVRAGIIEGDSDFLHNPDLSSSVFTEKYQELRAVFDNFEDSSKKHRNDIEHHNHETSIRVTMLKELSTVIRQFQTQLNTELSACHISNLSSIKLEIVVDSRFSTLQKELEDISFRGSELMSESFYTRLSTFCEEFFKESSTPGRRLQLGLIITSVQYRYEIDGKIEKASQSNGTNGMINSVLLALLLRRLIPQNTLLHFPIVFDEVGSLDIRNLNTIKRVAEDNGFVLFVANPTNNGVIGSVIENWYDLSLSRISEGQVVGKCAVLHYAMEEGIHDAETSEEDVIQS